MYRNQVDVDVTKASPLLLCIEYWNAKHIDSCARVYEANYTVCRHRLLFCRFLMFCEENIEVIGCVCCDICAKSCKCRKCI